MGIGILAAVSTENTDVFYIDDVIFYNERIIVDLSVNYAITDGTGTNATAYLKQNGNTVATGQTVWYDATATSYGTLVFVPTSSSYGDIEISGTDTFTIEADTTVFTDTTANEVWTMTIDLGNSASPADVYWYDVKGSDIVDYAGVTSTDKVTSSLTY